MMQGWRSVRSHQMQMALSSPIQARRQLRVVRNRARLAVSTCRPGATDGTNHVFIVTPWQKVKVPLQPGVWRNIELTVPGHLQRDLIEVEIVTFDHWFPAEECDSDDRRCLGVLVREEEKDAWRRFFKVPPLQVFHDRRARFVPLDATDAGRIAEFRYQAPQALVDW